MTLIGMAVYDTEENRRNEFTFKTLESLVETVDFTNHSLVIVDNKSSGPGVDETYQWLLDYKQDMINACGTCNIEIVYNEKNVGTAMAINQALEFRKPEQFFVKMDNDVVVYKEGWVEELEECITRFPSIGILGLKRKDVCESVYSINTDQRSKLIEVPHIVGQKWHVIEQCKHVMGTCTMLNPLLISKVGYFYQMDGLYGFDDSLMCIRSAVAGFLNCFMHGIEIDHIDPGGTEYTEWKNQYAHTMLEKYAQAEREYLNGTRNVYYTPFN